jgi:hypothetical protein
MQASEENTTTFDPNFYIFLSFGQSNMEGVAPIETQDRTVDPRFQVLQSLDCPNLKRNKHTWYHLKKAGELGRSPRIPQVQGLRGLGDQLG